MAVSGGLFDTKMMVSPSKVSSSPSSSPQMTESVVSLLIVSESALPSRKSMTGRMSPSMPSSGLTIQPSCGLPPKSISSVTRSPS